MKIYVVRELETFDYSHKPKVFGYYDNAEAAERRRVDVLASHPDIEWDGVRVFEIPLNADIN